MLSLKYPRVPVGFIIFDIYNFRPNSKINDHAHLRTNLHDEYPQGGYMITKRTFGALKDLGYPVSDIDFVIVDDPAFLKVLMLDDENEFIMSFPGMTSASFV